METLVAVVAFVALVVVETVVGGFVPGVVSWGALCCVWYRLRGLRWCAEDIVTRSRSSSRADVVPFLRVSCCEDVLRISTSSSRTLVMVFFWTAANADQKMFNLDFLKGLYDDYHKKGLEIYQVSLDVDKALWAKVVKQQNLPWINVCDSRGSASPYTLLYNIA